MRTHNKLKCFRIDLFFNQSFFCFRISINTCNNNIIDDLTDGHSVDFVFICMFDGFLYDLYMILGTFSSFSRIV